MARLRVLFALSSQARLNFYYGIKIVKKRGHHDAGEFLHANTQPANEEVRYQILRVCYQHIADAFKLPRSFKCKQHPLA